MDFSLTDEQRLLQRTVAEFMESGKVQHWIQETEKTKKFPRPFMNEAAGQGLLGINVAPEHGGQGLNALDAIIVFETIAYYSVGFSLNILVPNSLAAFSLENFGSKELKERYLPRMARGEILGCFANTEAEAGADAKNIQLSAVATAGDKWLLNGAKQLITLASEADVATIAARTSKRQAGHPGITAFFVEIGSGVPGFKLEKIEEKSAQPGSPLCRFSLSDFVTTDEHILGAVDNGWGVVNGTFQHSRIWVGAQAIGAARRAFDETLKYTSERRTFRKPVLDNQAVGVDLADVYAELEAARLLIYKAAYEETQKKDITALSSMAKYVACNVAKKAVDRCYECFGGISACDETISAQLHRDVPIIENYEGPKKIQLMIIWKHLQRLARS